MGYNPGSNVEYPTWYQTVLDNQAEYEESHTSSLSHIPQDAFSLSSEEYDALLGTETKSSLEDTQDDSDSCNSDNAVVIWEWPSAIQCWLKNLFKTEWETSVSDFSFDWKPYLSLTLGSHTLYSTEEETIPLPQKDANSDGVIDSIETDPISFSLRNTLSDYVLEPKRTVTLETYLEKGGIIVSDNTSQIQLVLVRMANLDTGKIYTSSDTDWESAKKQSLSVSGSDVLRNGKAVWKIQSLTNTRMLFEFETRIYSPTNIFVKSSPFTLSPESKFPLFTVLSSSGVLTPKTVRADDPRGITLLFSSDNAPNSVDVDIADYVTGKKILSLRSVPVVDKNLKMGSPAFDAVLHKAGKYTLTLTNKGVSKKTDLFIIP